jgi:hypothetical protein
MSSLCRDADSIDPRPKTVRAVCARLAVLIVLAAVFSALTSASTRAAEIDSITTRAVVLGNSVDAVNAIFNRRLREGVANANATEGEIGNMESHEFCDEDRLYAELRKAVFHSFIPRWGLRGYDLDLQLRDLLFESSYSLLLQDSIYRDINHLEGFSLKMKELSDVIRINGDLIGLDKIGHFFAEGWEYFERTRRGRGTIEEALRWGSGQEVGKFGYTTTGIFSFADLTANFNGWRFWNAIRNTQEDPLKDTAPNIVGKAYVKCNFQIIDSLKHRKVVKSWHLSRHFDFSEYVDGAWDEGNNCNSYADPAIEEKVKNRISEVSAGLRCPVAPKRCQSAQQKYGKFSKYILHPSCLTMVKD